MIRYIFPALCFAATATLAAGEALDVQIKDAKKQTTLVIRQKVKRDEIGAALAKIYGKNFGYVGKNKIQMLSAPMAKYTKIDAETFDMEAGIVVPEGTRGEGDIAVSELPAGKVAFAVHVGPYENLPKTYEAIHAAIEAKGYKGTGTSWEIYISDPGDTKPEELKTEIYLVVEEKK